MSDMNDLIAPAAGAAAGGLSVVWMAKTFFGNWLKKQDEAQVILRDLEKAMAVTLHRLKTIEDDINGLGVAMRSRYDTLCKRIPTTE